MLGLVAGDVLVDVPLAPLDVPTSMVATKAAFWLIGPSTGLTPADKVESDLPAGAADSFVLSALAADSLGVAVSLDVVKVLNFRGHPTSILPPPGVR